jgi:polar amino acid transport system substrate-binding protein
MSTVCPTQGAALGAISLPDMATLRRSITSKGCGRLARRTTRSSTWAGEQTFALLHDGKTEVMASTRLVLLDFWTKLTGARVLADRYGANINRMVVPKGKADWRAYINDFVEEAKASGAIQQFIERGGTRGVTVAPLGNSD